MTVDTARAFFTYLTALIVVIGGIYVIYVTRVDVAAAELRVIMAGFVGAALQFLFGASVASQTAARAGHGANGDGSTPNGPTPNGPTRPNGGLAK